MDHRDAALRQALEALESVLCDPEGRASIRGSAADNAVIDRALAAIRAALEAPQPEPLAPPRFMPLDQSRPDAGTDCVVIVNYGGKRFYAVDRWDVQREDPTGMGGQTIETGEGFNDHFDEEVVAWAPLPDVTAPNAAPPQRVPLTDEQIDAAIRDAADSLLDHIYEYGTAAEGIQSRLRKIARAVERAHGIT